MKPVWAANAIVRHITFPESQCFEEGFLMGVLDLNARVAVPGDTQREGNRLPDRYPEWSVGHSNLPVKPPHNMNLSKSVQVCMRGAE